MTQTAMIPDPRVPVLAEVITDLLAGYCEVRRMLIEEYGAPPDVQEELLGTLRSAAGRAASVLTVR